MKTFTKTTSAELYIVAIIDDQKLKNYKKNFIKNIRCLIRTLNFLPYWEKTFSIFYYSIIYGQADFYRNVRNYSNKATKFGNDFQIF